MFRIAYVVPTMNRPGDLSKLLESLKRQTVAPAQIIIVDGGDETVEELTAGYPDLPLTYVREYPPSLARQRNAGMARLEPDIEIAGYLDDDLVLEDNATEQMATFWSTAKQEVGGAAFSIINQPSARLNHLTQFFLTNSATPGKLLPSGFPSQIPYLETTTETDWLYGGATMWRRDVINAYDYDNWYLGHGFGEDLDFSFRVRQQYKLFVVGYARVYHFPKPIRSDRLFDLGRQQVINRLYFAKKMGCFSKLAMVWAHFGQAVVNAGSTLRRLDSGGIRLCAGNLIGTIEYLTGRAGRVGGFMK
jgi:glycosyltransferase involved in cell wall biosynthesis